MMATFDPNKAVGQVQAARDAGTIRDTRPQAEWDAEQGRLDAIMQRYEDDQRFGTGQQPEFAAGAPGIESMPNWQSLTKGEKWLYGMLPRIPAWVDEKIPDALKTAWGPVGTLLSPVIQAAGKALSWLDIGAEAGERLYGLSAQAVYASRNGTMGEFLKNLPAAWKAGTFAANVLNPEEFTGDATGPDRWKPAAGELPGVYGLVRARQMFAAGMTTEQVDASLSGELGAMWIRGQMQDLMWHMVLDPLNVAIGWLKPMTRLKSAQAALRRTAAFEEMSSGGKMAEYLAGLTADVSKAAEATIEGRKAASILGQVPEEVGLAAKVAGVAVDGGRITEGALIERVGVTADQIGALEKAGVLRQVADDMPGSKTFEVVNAAKLADEYASARQVASGLEGAIAAEEKARDALRAAEAWIEEQSQHRLGTFGRKMLWAFGGDPIRDAGKATFALYSPEASFFKPWTWFKLTPQAKAVEFVTNMSDTLGFLIKDMDVERATQVIGNLAGTLLDPKMGHALYTAEGRAVTMALQGFKQAAEDRLAAWNASQGSRELLERISATLGMVDDDVINAIQKGNVDRIMADLAQAAVKPKTTAAAAIKGMIERGELTKEGVELIAKTFLDGQVPYNKDVFRLHMIGAAADFVEIQLRAQLGEQYAGMLEKATSALKAAETLAYLRLNPTYPIRNFLNNELTMWARGVWGVMSDKKITAFWGRMGIDPARLGQGMGPAELATRLRETSAGKASKVARLTINTAIADAEKSLAIARQGKKGIFDSVREAINNVNLGKADMGVWAATIEAQASRRSYTVAFMEGMRNYWRPGQYMSLEEYVGKYHPGVNVGSLPPEIKARVEGALRQAMTVREVEDAVLGKYAISVSDVLDDAVKGTGYTTDELRAFMGDEFWGAVSDELVAPLAKGDALGVRRVLENVRVALKDQLDDWTDKDYQAIIDNVAARCQATNDPTAYVRVYSEIQDGSIAALEGYIRRIGQSAENIRQLPREAQRGAWDAVMKESDDFFERAIKRDDARLEGLMQAGRNGGAPLAGDVMDPYRALTKATRQFYREKQDLLKAFFRKEFNSPESRQAAWDKLMGHLDQSYGEMIESQMKASAALDGAVVRYVDSVNPSMSPHVQAWRATLRDLRRQYMVDVKAAQRHVQGILDEGDKAKAYKEMAAMRENYMGRLHRAEREGIEALENGTYFGGVRGMDPDTMAMYRSHFPEAVRKEAQTLYDEVVKATGDNRLAEQAATSESVRLMRMAYSHVERGISEAGRATSESMSLASKKLKELEAKAGRLLTQDIVTASAIVKEPAPRLTWLQYAMDQVTTTAERARVQDHMLKTWDEMDDAARVKWLGENGGEWFSIEAKVPGLEGDALHRKTYELEQDLLELGYRPVKTEGIWDGEKSGDSFLVLGGRDEHAFALGKKYDQEAVALRNGFLTTSTRGGREVGVLLPSRGHTGVDIATDPNGMFFQGKGGTKVGFRMDIDFEGPSVQWQPVIRNTQGRIELTHFSKHPERLSILHPDDPRTSSGARGVEGSYSGRGSVNYYLKDTNYEPAVVGAAKHEYHVSVRAEDLYDLGRDPKRIVAKFRQAWQQAFEAGQRGTMVGSPQYERALFEALAEEGYIGITNQGGNMANGVKIFRPMAPSLEPGKPAFLGDDLNLPSFGRDYVEAAMVQHFGLTPKDAEKVGTLVDARAKVWAARTGQSKSTWYTTHLRGIVSGEPGEAAVAAKAALYERGRAPSLTAKQVVRKLHAYGTLDPDDAIEMLGGPQAPERIHGYVQYLRERRQRLLEKGFEPRETVKAYLMTAGTAKTSKADARLVDRVLDRFGIVMDPSGSQQATMLYRMREEAAWVSPEDFMGMILNTNDGRKLIDILASGPGHVDEEWAMAFIERIDSARQAAFGRRAVSTLFPGRTKSAGLFEVKDICDALNKGAARGEAGEFLFKLEDVSRELQRLQGIGPVKHNFLAQYLGIGNKPTIDSREIGFWIGGGRKLTPDAAGHSFRNADGVWVHGRPVLKGNRETLASAVEYFRSTKSKEVIEAADRAIADSFAELRKRGIGADWDEEEWGAAMHRWIWEAVGEEATYGDASYMAMRLAEDTTKGIPAGAIIWDQEYRAVIGAFQSATPATVIHELGHLFRGDLAGPDLQKVERFLGITDGVWRKDHHEWFADAFLKWVKEGSAPSRELVPIFQHFKDWLRQAWGWVTGQDLGRDAAINDEIRGVFSRMFDETAPGYENLAPRPGIRGTMFDRIAPEQPRIGEGMDELNWREGGNVLQRIQVAAENRIAQPRDLAAQADPQWQKILQGYSEHTSGRMLDAQMQANDFAKMKRDSALLNYHARTHFDHALGQGVPFGFWTTHSAYNWFMWSVDKPKFIADFMRLRNFQQRNGTNKYAPARLQGMWPLGRMPFLPSWLGPLYVDPLRAALPFDIWSEPLDSAIRFGTEANTGAENILRRSLSDGKITQAEFDEAIRTRSGPTWAAAITEAKKSVQGNDPFESIGMLIQPHAPMVWALKAAQGKQDEIGPFLPITGTVKGLSALLGVPGGVNPEGWLRKRLGLPEFDKWEDYRVDRMLSNMAADGAFSVNDIMRAMIDRKGPVFEEAKRRAGIEYGVMKVSGSLGIPVKAWPEGEQKQKVLNEGLQAAYDAWRNGDQEAVGKFLDAHPEARVRMALFDTPEERAQKFLVDQLWSKWNSYGELERQAVKDALGEDFTDRFLSKETRAYDSIDVGLMATWLKLMGSDPGLLTVPATGGPSAIKFPPAAIVKASASFYQVRDQYFPWQAIKPLSDAYFKLASGADRAKFMRENPLLKRYWDWRRKWIYQNPQVAPYIEEDPTKLPRYSQRELERLSAAPMNLSPDEWRVVLGPATFNLLLDYKRQGTALPEAAEARAKRLAEQYGMTLEQIVGQLK